MTVVVKIHSFLRAPRAFHTIVLRPDEDFESEAAPSSFVVGDGGDIIILSSWAEFEAEGEGGEELELLGELERPVGGQGPVALPALEPFGGVVAGAIAVVVHHVEDVALRPVVRHRADVVRAVDVKVVVDAHVDVVIATVKFGVGPVPEDCVTVGHHLGGRVLSVHTHPDDEDEEEQHFHLRHIRAGSPRADYNDIENSNWGDKEKSTMRSFKCEDLALHCQSNSFNDLLPVTK